MAGEEFAVEMEEEVKKDVEDELEDGNWGPHEDSAPSTHVTSTKAQQVN